MLDSPAAGVVGLIEIETLALQGFRCRVSGVSVQPGAVGWVYPVLNIDY